MSFKLFFASTFGLIQSTKKLELAHENLLADFRLYSKFEKSDELKEFHELELLVNSPTFMQKKKEIQHLSLSGSMEEAQQKELKEIERKNHLQEFYQLLKSEELKRFEKISSSELLATHAKLKATVRSFSAFSPKDEELKRIEILVTNEFKQLKESDDLKFFNQYRKSADYKNYLRLKGTTEPKHLQELRKITASDEFLRFEKITASGLPASYEIVKAKVKSFSMFSPKKEDVKREEIRLASEFRKLKESDDWKFFNRFGKSAAYKNYLRLKDSPERKRFEELEAIAATTDFKIRVAYLADTRKWEKTLESGREKRFAEMQKLPQLVNFRKYKNSDAFDFFRKWELVFEDRFETGKLDTRKWMTQSYWASQALGRNFSQTGDLHAFTEGQNIVVGDNSLKIEVRKEKTKGMQWQIPFGFVEQEFDYTSGIISTGGSGWWKYGILEAKVKYDPSSHFVDAFYLLGDEGSPQINLIEMGVKNRVGLFSKTSEGIHAESEAISGLKTGEYYIFRLEWTTHSLVWKINNREVFVLKHNVPAFKIHLNAASIVVSEPGSAMPHRFEIDWVRLYQQV